MLLTSKGSLSQCVFPQEEMVTQRECEFTHAFGPQDGEFIMTSDERISVLDFLLVACFSGLGLKSKVKRSKKGSLKSRIWINIARHLLAGPMLSSWTSNNKVCRSEYLSISRAEVDFSRVIGQCFCLKVFKMRSLTDLTDRKH